MELWRFWIMVGVNKICHDDWRWGQAIFNTLMNSKPNMASSIRGTKLDAFADNSRVPSMADWITKHWEDYPIE